MSQAPTIHQIKSEFSQVQANQPVVLLPVRLETRFIKVKHIYRPQNGHAQPRFDDKRELWVRIYPDDISVTTHEVGLTAAEIEAGQVYWEAWYAAQGDEALHLGAWRQLCMAHGPERAAYVARTMQPPQFDPVGQSFSAAPTFAVTASKSAAWTQAPQTFALPEQFVIILHYRNGDGDLIPLYYPCEPVDGPLQVGPDPEGTASFSMQGGELDLPGEMKWMADFDEAVRRGMAVRIPLVEIEAFENLVALGLNPSLSSAVSRDRLQSLLEKHRFTKGLSIVPQGTPTNNTAESSAGSQEVARSVDSLFKAEREGLLYQDQSDPLLRKDGQWLSDALGLSRDFVGHLAHSDGEDIAHALNLNTALWPATLRFYLENMMYPNLDEDTLNRTGEFFSKNVSGRGHIPTLRIGDQPYSVLTTSNFKQWSVLAIGQEFQAGLIYFFLKGMYGTWERLSENVQSLGVDSITDVDEALLKVLGLHASSIEFHQRFLADDHFLQNLESAASSSGNLDAPDGGPVLAGLGNAGHTPLAVATLFNAFATEQDRLLNGPLVDGVPVSELNPVEVMEGKTSNYLDWLVRANYEMLQTENYANLSDQNPDEVADPEKPRAMLYLLLRHALLLEYAEASFKTLKENNPGLNIGKAHLATPIQLNRALTAQEVGTLTTAVRDKMTQDHMLSVDAQNGLNEFKNNQQPLIAYDLPVNFETLVNAEVARQVDQLEGNAMTWYDLLQNFPIGGTQPMWEFIEVNLGPPPADRIDLSTVKSAVGRLKEVPSACLERALTEHLDLVSFRLDAWIAGLYQERLANLRANGIHGLRLGAFGYLEDLRAHGDYGAEVLEAVRKPGVALTATGRQSFDFLPDTQFAGKLDWVYIGDPNVDHELEWDANTQMVVPFAKEQEGSQGFVHTASVNQAIAAAILRAGYTSDEDLPEALAVNLNSERVRTALFYMEGVRNGQELGALLGYRLERAFRDKHPGRALQRFLGDLRQAYPLVAGGGQAQVPTGPVAQLEANHVVDGLKLLEALREAGSSLDWASGFDFGMEESLVIEEVEALRNEMDAVADLSLAEAIFQMGQGRRERADAVLQAMNGEQPFPEIEFIRTPRSSNTLKHRVCLHMNPETSNNVFWNPRSSRAYAEPHLNTFLGRQMLQAGDICFNAYLDTEDAEGNVTTERRKIRLDELAMQPIDFFLVLARQLDDPGNAALSRYIAYFARLKYFQTDAGTIRVSFTTRNGFTAGQFTLMECIGQLEALVDVVRNARPLGHNDLFRAGEVPQGAGAWDLDELRARLVHALDGGGRPYSLKSIGRQLFYALKDIRRDKYVPRNAGILRQRLMDCTKLNLEDTFPVSVITTDIVELEELLLQGDRVSAALLELHTAATARMLEGDVLEGEARKRAYIEAFQLIFGPDFIVLPCFVQDDPASFAQAKAYAESGDLLRHSGDFAIEEWWQGVVGVRPAMQDLMRLSLLNEALHEHPRLPTFLPMQLPATPNAHWVGVAYPDNWTPPGDTLSLVNLFSPGYAPTGRQVGLVLDEWTEAIPGPRSNTGVAMHYNQPDAKPPQSILLCLSPNHSGNWDYDALVQVILATFDLAKMRAVDPDQIKESGYAQMLPATYAVHHGDPAFPHLDYAANIGRTYRGVLGSQLATLIPRGYEDFISNQENN